eukprot:TRINITY_DN499_c0_g3_i1.p2 TRINITY_DN499_c0_g3~~TRINITY_DN499_c0_g3_i1.p2  ORF type:complete len:189 (+),score=61.06 TRINITY_DN499_c0_g3_i1:96-662(+)
MPSEIIAGDYASIDWSRHIVLQSNDDDPVEFVVCREAASMSGLIKDMLDDQDGDHQQTVIPIPNVSAVVLRYVLEYVEHHWNRRPLPIDKPLRGRIQDAIGDWDRAFLFTDLIKDGDERQHDLLVDVIMAANFLNIKDLLELCCGALASIVKGKSPQEIKVIFNIEKDFTPEEDARIREEHKWVEDCG